MSSMETIACIECGEQTIAARPTCGLCEADKGLMPMKTRGAIDLIGATIVAVDERAINEIKLIGADGITYIISAEAGPLGIPVISVEPK